MLESGCYEKWERTNYYTMMKSIYEAQVAAKVDVPVSASVKECRKVCKAGSCNPRGVKIKPAYTAVMNTDLTYLTI